MKAQLNLWSVIGESYKIAITNFFSILISVILWILTIWIPYLNVGTTIAISSLPIELSKGNVMSPGAIFDSKYRKYFGEYFILQGLITMAMVPALLFLIVPAIVLSISWSLSVYLLIDKGLSPTEALLKSTELTYGNKWTIFLIKVFLFVIEGIIILIGLAIASSESQAAVIIGILIIAIASLLLFPLFISANAVIYKNLTQSEQTTENIQ